MGVFSPLIMNSEMKKVILSLLLFIFVAMATGYAGIYKSQEADDGNYAGGIYDNPSASSGGDDSGSGFFRSSEPNPGGRPGDGGGIGQDDKDDAPLGNGIVVLSACCVLFVIAKEAGRKLKK